MVRNYENSKVYAIRSNDSDNIYIGSTTSSLSKRLSDHRTQFKAWLNQSTKPYYTSFEILKHPNHYIELMEEYPCENKMQLEKREGELIRKHKGKAVNKVINGRTVKERYYDTHEKQLQDKQKYHNSDKGKEKNTEYRETHKNDKAEYDRKRRAVKCECECGGRYTLAHKSAHFKSLKHCTFLHSK